MSDLGTIFHVKKNGTQYDAHAYSTTDECPYPNLKIKFKGQQAYVKTEQGQGNGDVPCYVKDKAGSIYQVKKEAISVPTGSVSVGNGDIFSVPPGIKIIQVFMKRYIHDETTNNPYTYVRVTPGKKYKLQCYTYIIGLDDSPGDRDVDGLYLGSIDGTKLRAWFKLTPAANIRGTQGVRGFKLSWAPEMNEVPPTYIDY